MNDAAAYLEKRRSGLGASFLDHLESTFEVVLEAPHTNPVLEADVRRRRVPRFSYDVYYRVLEDHVRILAIHHHSRGSDYWRGRK